MNINASRDRLRIPVAQPSFGAAQRTEGDLVNDVHSQLNPVCVDRIVSPASLEALQRTVETARREGKAISIAGGRYAMGSQQFGSGTILIDTRKLNRVLNFDVERGTLEVEAGIQWPELIESYLRFQKGSPQQWGIAQKQTGADRFTIGGTLAANAHSRGLARKPIIADVESLVLVDANGNTQRCSRSENAELFRLVIGGYGLFGIVSSVTLRLVRRQKAERVVTLTKVDDLMASFEKRIADGFLYGDLQVSIDEKSEDFLRKGVFSCYRPVDPSTPIAAGQKELSEEDWRTLVYLAHADKKQAFDTYARYYLSTNGQIYWSDTHQLSVYLENYHRSIDRKLHAAQPATEVMTEIYVPRSALSGFLEEAREDFRKNNVDLIYGTIRLIERDDESFLAWAKQPYACTVFNLHTVHTSTGSRQSADAFCRLIDMAIRRGGTYYLTYHKYATRQQVLACYPEFPEFLRLKKRYDPAERFQSDWYRHYKKMFADVIG